MFMSREDLIEEIESHIRKSGGRFGEWCVGTAKDCRGPFFRRHLVADPGDGLAGENSDECQVTSDEQERRKSKAERHVVSGE